MLVTIKNVEHIVNSLSLPRGSAGIGKFCCCVYTVALCMTLTHLSYRPHQRLLSRGTVRSRLTARPPAKEGQKRVM